MFKICIELDKVDKSKIYKGKNGREYLFLYMAENRQPDQFGNTHSIWNDQTKEERENKEGKVYCGSGKVVTYGDNPNQKR